MFLSFRIADVINPPLYICQLRMLNECRPMAHSFPLRQRSHSEQTDWQTVLVPFMRVSALLPRRSRRPRINSRYAAVAICCRKRRIWLDAIAKYTEHNRRLCDGCISLSIAEGSLVILPFLLLHFSSPFPAPYF